MKTYTLIMSSGCEMVVKSSSDILEEWIRYKRNPCLILDAIFIEDNIAIDLSKVDAIKTKSKVPLPPPPPPTTLSPRSSHRDFSGLLKKRY